MVTDETLEELETDFGYIVNLAKAAKRATANGYMSARLQDAARLVDFDAVQEDAIPALFAEVRRLRRENAAVKARLRNLTRLSETVVDSHRHASVSWKAEDDLYQLDCALQAWAKEETKDGD